MSRLPFLPLWTDDYLADTRHLTTAEHGAYMLLLIEAWRRPKCDLPDDDALLARLTGMTADAWTAAKPIIMAFWKRDGRSRTWTQLRLRSERDRSKKQSGFQRDRATKRWKTTEKDDAGALPRQSPGNATPDTISLPIGKGAEAPEIEKSEAELQPIKPDPPSPPDPAKALFDAGVTLLRSAGLTPRSARGLVAKWRHDRGDAWTREAIVSAEGKSDPVSWIEARRKAGAASEDEARAASSATAERYRRMAIPGPPPGVLAGIGA